MRITSSPRADGTDLRSGPDVADGAVRRTFAAGGFLPSGFAEGSTKQLTQPLMQETGVRIATTQHHL
jgi:hypothetical protein